jgi:hypothetical protein
MILYLQLSVWPLPVRFKIGITRRSWKGRSRNIAKTTPGLQFPLPLFIIVPFPAFWEGLLHRHFSHCHAPMADGSGKTEWFRVGWGCWNLWEAIAFYVALMGLEVGAVYLAWKYFVNY